MKYTLEVVIQTQFICMFSMSIQLFLIVITMADFYSMPSFGVVIPDHVIVVYSRIFCALIMHLQTEP
jgi:hypothetical protein